LSPSPEHVEYAATLLRAANDHLYACHVLAEATDIGIAGQLLLSHALAAVTGFPISLGVETTVIIASFAWATALALTIIAVPGSLAVQATPRATSATT
jgi:hypothetical protein